MAHLVFQSAFPGDLFLSIPLLRRIKVWDPTTPLVLACRPGLGEFFLKAKLVDEVIEIDKNSAQGRGTAQRKLKAGQWDIIFVPHESPRTALWIWGLKAKRAKVGFKKWWNAPMFSKRVVKPMQLPDALRQLSLLTPFDAELAQEFATPQTASLASPLSLAQLDLRQTPIPEWASMTLNEHHGHGARVFLAPGSVWPTKRWTVEGYEELARQLQLAGYKVELVGSRQEQELCAQIAAHVPQVINHAGSTSLAGLVDLFRAPDAAALICNDSGAMHAASVAGLPTVAIFGPTTLALGFRPWQQRAVVVQREMKCRPCGKHGAKSCPIGTHECMRGIRPTEVMNAVQQIIANTL